MIADLVGAAFAVPDAVLGELAIGAAGRCAPADEKFLDRMIGGLGAGGIELAVDVDLEATGGIAGGGDVGPEVGDDFFLRDEDIAAV